MSNLMMAETMFVERARTMVAKMFAATFKKLLAVFKMSTSIKRVLPMWLQW